MIDMRRIAGLVALMSSMGLSAQVILRDQPDEMISRHLLGTDLWAIYPSISDDGRYVAYQGEHPDFYGDAVWVTDRQAPLIPLRAGATCDEGSSACEASRPRISGNGR